jgi:hypothetical protein
MTDDRTWPTDAWPPPCPNCGGRVLVLDHDGECLTCATGAKQPDPETYRRAHRDAAVLLRSMARRAGKGYLAQFCLQDAEWHERQAIR